MSRRAVMAGMSAAVIAVKADGMAPDNRVAVCELRQYTLHARRRDALIEIFEREFLSPQEQLGAKVLGTFRDLDDPDRFVWLRGFADMAARAHALSAFYSGPVWQANRNAANATMLDSDNVLLLNPRPPSRDAFEALSVTDDDGVYGLSIHYLGETEPAAFADFMTDSVARRLGTRSQSIVTFVSETATNNFPRLPVREKDRVFAWLSRWRTVDEMDRAWTMIDQSVGWRDGAPERLMPALVRKPERLRLEPTLRSRMR